MLQAVGIEFKFRAIHSMFDWIHNRRLRAEELMDDDNVIARS